MAKFDVQNAYHIVPVHPEDRPLLGMKWQEISMWTWSFLLAPLPDFEVSLDASGALGYGALFQCHWFSVSWLTS